MKVINVVGARPNFMKIAPLYLALSKVRWAQPVIVHTGQHYEIKRRKVGMWGNGMDSDFIESIQC